MATYSTRIYVKVDSSELMSKLGTIDMNTLGKGFYSAENVFATGSAESYFHDTESAFNESDIQELVGKVAEVINGHGVILADTFSYDYDPMPCVCFFDGSETVSKVLDMDGEEFQETVDIRNVQEWLRFVKDAEDIGGEWG